MAHILNLQSLEAPVLELVGRCSSASWSQCCNEEQQ